MRKRILGFCYSMMVCLIISANNYSVSKEEQDKILEEAENWIDDMPAGLQDRLSDAVNHSMHGFGSEIEYFRNMADTTGIGQYSVLVRDIKGGTGSDINMRMYSSDSLKIKPLLIYLHGGGWSIGSLATSDKFCRALASEGNVNVISMEYPLSPENPYPAALNKIVQGVEYIFTHAGDFKTETHEISLGGDGAGGNLALEAYLRLKENCPVKSLVLYYPLLQTSGELDRELRREFGRGYGFDSRLWEIFVNAYKATDESQIKTLPPTLLISAGRDIVIDKEKEFSLQNSNVEYVEFSGALHGFLTDGHQPTAFKKTVELTDLFLTEK